MGGCASQAAQEQQRGPGPAQRTNDDLYPAASPGSTDAASSSAFAERPSFHRMEGITVLLLSVLSYLNAQDVCARAAHVSKLWHSTLRSKSANRFWTSLYAVSYPDQRSIDCDSSVSPQKLFSDRASLWHGIVLPKGDFVVDWVSPKYISASPTDRSAATTPSPSASKTHCLHRVRYFLDSFKLTFNCDGEALKFSNLTMTVVSDPNTRKLLSIVFSIDQVPRQQVKKVISVMADLKQTVSTLLEPIDELCSVDRIVLAMGPNDGLALLSARLPVAGIKHLFALQDSVGGSICLDLYYFKLSLIQHVAPQAEGGWSAFLLSQPDFQSLSPWMQPRAFAARQKNQNWYRCTQCDPEELYAICSFCITHAHKGHAQRSWIGCTDSRVYTCGVCGEDGSYPASASSSSSSSSSGSASAPLPSLPLPLCAGMVFKGQVDAVATSADKVKKVWHLQITILSLEPAPAMAADSKLAPLIRFQAELRRRPLASPDDVVPAQPISGALNPALGALQFRDRSSGAFFFGQWQGRQLKGIWSIGADVEQQHAGLGLSCTLTLVSDHALSVPQSWFASIISYFSSASQASLGPAAETLFDLLTGDQATLYKSKFLLSAGGSYGQSGNTPVGVQLLCVVVQRLWEAHGDVSSDRVCVLPMLRLVWALLSQVTPEAAAFPLTPLAQADALGSLDAGHTPASTSALDCTLQLLAAVVDSGRSHVDERVIALRSLVDAGWQSAGMELILLRHTTLLTTVAMPLLRRVDEAALVNGVPLISSPVALFKVLTPQTVPLVRECFRLVQCVACNTTAGRKLLLASGHAALTLRVCASIDFLKLFAADGLKSAEGTAPAFAGTKDVISLTEEQELIALIDAILSASANLLQEPAITTSLVLCDAPLVTLETFSRLVSQLPVCAQLQSFFVSSLAALANVVEHRSVSRGLYYSESEVHVAVGAVSRLMGTLAREETAKFDQAESRLMLRCLGSFVHYSRLHSIQATITAPRYDIPSIKLSATCIFASEPALWQSVVPRLLTGFKAAYVALVRALLTDPATESDLSSLCSTLSSWLNLLCSLLAFADTAEDLLQRSDLPRMVCALFRLDESLLAPYFFTLYPALFRFFNMLCVFQPAFVATVLATTIEDSHEGALAQQRLQALTPVTDRISFKFGAQDIVSRIESALAVALSDAVHGSLLERVSLASSLSMLLTRLFLDGHVSVSSLSSSTPSLIERFCEILEFDPAGDLDLEFTEIDFRSVDSQRRISERLAQADSPDGGAEGASSSSSSSLGSGGSSNEWLSSSVCMLAWCARAAVTRSSNLSRARFTPTLDSATADLLGHWRAVQGRSAPGGAPSAAMSKAQQWIKHVQARFHDTIDL